MPRAYIHTRDRASGKPDGASALYPDYVRLSASPAAARGRPRAADRKSTRLNSSHTVISYAVFCLQKTTLGAQHLGDLRRQPAHRPDRLADRRTAVDLLARAGRRVLLAARRQLAVGRFFFNVPATAEIYTLSLHDALPI